MRADKRAWDKSEPARSPEYRRLYHRYKHDVDRLDDMITLLLKRIVELEHRVNVLEIKDDDVRIRSNGG